MTACAATSTSDYSRCFRRFYAVDLPFVGQLNINFSSVRSRTFFGAISADGGRYMEAWAGPMRLEFDYMPHVRPKRGTLALVAMALLATAGLAPRIPFLG